MNRFSRSLPCALLLVACSSPTLAAAAPVTMVCVAAHPGVAQQFAGEGLRWIGSHKALEACQAYADEAGLDTSACRIVSCEPTDLGDLAL